MILYSYLLLSPIYRVSQKHLHYIIVKTNEALTEDGTDCKINPSSYLKSLILHYFPH